MFNFSSIVKKFDISFIACRVLLHLRIVLLTWFDQFNFESKVTPRILISFFETIVSSKRVIVCGAKSSL